MIQENLLLIVSLLAAVSMLAMLSEKLKISYPILLVIAGLFISFIPGIPVVSLSPDMVFLLFLPPLLYAAAWNTSWRDFWAARRAISMLAFGLVIFTSTAIALVSQVLIPDFPLALGFLLGGIISPPDAVAATSVLQGIKVPKRVVTILEGESLINDASSLIVFRFALAATLTGEFTLMKATTDFFMVAGLGIAIGLAIAHVLYAVHKFLPTTPSIDTSLTVIAPYLMYIAAEHFHFSGVMAVVSGGLFLSFRSHEIFSYNTRIQAYSVWESLIFILNGLVFILIGLQLPQIITGLEQYTIVELVFYALVISILTVIVRIVWVFSGAYLSCILSKKEKRMKWENEFLIAWSGMRGVVSLASALAVPLTLDNKLPFPHRDLLLFITFVVILFTLVFQGLSLSPIIKWLNIKDEENEEAEHEITIRLRLAEAVLNHLQTNYTDELTSIDAYTRIKDRYERMVDIANRKLLKEENAAPTPHFLPKYRRMLLELVAIRRSELDKLRSEKHYSDELLRTKEYELDLEEARLNEN
ncbi:Na+/H+ antiporter [Runella sp.]|uniref:Na+/H+ antiporter n=1 Tax=Runella sp. TaxID=1960881 RepID=UPI003D13AC1F